MPVNRGIVATCYLKGDAEACHEALTRAYVLARYGGRDPSPGALERLREGAGRLRDRLRA